MAIGAGSEAVAAWAEECVDLVVAGEKTVRLAGHGWRYFHDCDIAAQYRSINLAIPSHRHARRREKIMGRFKSPGQAQRFLSVHDQTAALFRPKRHRLSARSYRHARNDAFDLWTEYANELTA
jgi:transposase-like protein